MIQPFVPPARPLINEEEVDPVAAVMRTGMIAQGPQVATFEEEFCTALVPGVQAVAVNSGTSVLHLGLLATRIGPGDEVVILSFTFAVTASSVVIMGAAPMFVDIGPLTFTLSPTTVETTITPRTRTIMPVHLYGHPTPVDALQAIAGAHGLMVFEGTAQAHGANLYEHAIGSFDTFATFSFYPTKNMTSGEGGMVTSSDLEVIRGVKLARNQGMETRYANEIMGLNDHMTDIYATIGRVQPTKVGEWTRARQDNTAFLDAHLCGVTVPHVAPDAMHVCHQYTIRVAEDRDGFAAALREEHGIDSGVHYPIPNHELPSLAYFAPGLGLAATREAADQVLSLPIYPPLTPGELGRIVEAVNVLAEAGA